MSESRNEANALPKVYVFINGGEAGWLYGTALAEDGTHLAGHVSSSSLFVRRDMGVDVKHDWSHKREKYAAHYPNGYEIVDLVSDDPRVAPRGDAGFARAIERAEGGGARGGCRARR